MYRDVQPTRSSLTIVARQVLNDADNDAFNKVENCDEETHSLTIRELEKAPKTGTIRHLSYRSIDDVLSRVAAAKLGNTNQKLLARNL